MTELRSPVDQRRPTVGPTPRDAAATALVLGFAGSAWGGWANANPQAGWALPLGIGSGLGLLLAVVAGIRTFRYRAGESAMGERRGRLAYYRTVGIEAALILLGVLGLNLTGQQDYLAAWVLFVVGAHFIPLGRLFRIGGLIVAGGLLVAVAGAAVLAGVVGWLAPSVVAGTGGLVVMVVAGVFELGRSTRTGRRS